MGILYKNIEDLCEKHNITGYRLCKDCGISPNVMTELRTGRRSGVSAKTADKIANYFGVSVSYLLGTQKDSEAEASEPLSEEKKQIISLLNNLSDDDLKKAYILFTAMFPNA